MFEPPNADYAGHFPYRIHTRDGHLLMKVRNHFNAFLLEPETVPLAPSEYTVRAFAANAGVVSVPIVIAIGQTTIVDLIGAVLPQGGSASNNASWVRLPSGLAIGEKSHQPPG